MYIYIYIIIYIYIYVIYIVYPKGEVARRSNDI